MQRYGTCRRALSICLFLASVLIITSHAVAAPASTQTSSPTELLVVAPDGNAFVGRPVVLSVTVTNNADAPLSYWCGGPGSYPQAETFSVIISGPDGTSREVTPTNGQYVEGSGRSRLIRRGESIQTPLAIEPLPAGVWSLQVRTRGWGGIPKSPPIRLKVAVDATAAADWDQKLLGKMRKGDPFARHLATTYHIDTVINAAFSDLASDNDATSLSAAQTLFDVRPLPAGADKAIRTAISAQLARPKFGADMNVLAWLMALAGESPTDDMLESVLAVSHSEVDSSGSHELRHHAVAALRYFPQKKAIDELTACLHDSSKLVSDGARYALDHPWRPRPTTQAAPSDGVKR